MAPTAISPPYLSREELKQTEMMLSVLCMMNVDRPSAMQGARSFISMRMFWGLSRRLVFLPIRKLTTHTQEMPWESTVASAAPRTPMFSPKMKSGSSTMLHTAPMRTVSMPVVAKPCAVMNAFMPSVSSTNSVPSA